MQSNLQRALLDAVLASGWNQGKALDVIVKDDQIVISIAGKPRYSLEELIAQCEEPAPAGTDI
jgi:antitoxin component of MazEF toxin-antitoxin module